MNILTTISTCCQEDAAILAAAQEVNRPIVHEEEEVAAEVLRPPLVSRDLISILCLLVIVLRMLLPISPMRLEVCATRRTLLACRFLQTRITRARTMIRSFIRRSRIKNNHRIYMMNHEYLQISQKQVETHSRPNETQTLRSANRGGRRSRQDRVMEEAHQIEGEERREGEALGVDAEALSGLGRSTRRMTRSRYQNHR